VHTVESFTTAVSGISHVAHKNVDWGLFARLVIPGVIGGVLGAYVLTHISAEAAKPIKYPPQERQPRMVVPLGLVGGFLDAAGGGGWGPVVTSNLVVQGTSPRKAIGTVNTAEFFLTVTITGTFIAALGAEAFTIPTTGLLIGGVAAAPLGAFVAAHVPPKPLLIAIGIILTITSLYGVYSATD
jgi:uncharacterized membrane protein YfcA